MLRNSDGDTEILLGNKQLLGIFFVVAVLLGVAFAGGYKVGQSSRKPVTVGTDETAAAAPSGGGETHALPGDSPSASSTAAPGGSTDTAASSAPEAPPPPTDTAPAAQPEQKPPPPSTAGDSEAAAPPQAAPLASGFTPQPGQTFLQVAAVTRDEAEAIADVLHKKGFRAHAVPKPGTNKLYRVLIGPMRDATDLNNTRASLRSTGFREIFVQRY